MSNFIMKGRIEKILTNIENVKEDLLALSDDIWLNIDHNNPQALQRGVEFKTAYNDHMNLFTSNADSLSILIQKYTEVDFDQDEDPNTLNDIVLTNQDRERMIKELNPHLPHSLNEDFRYKRPFGFMLEKRPYVSKNTWSQVYFSVLKHLAKKSPTMFEKLPENPFFVSSHGNLSFSTSKKELRSGRSIGMGIYAEFKLGANQIRDSIEALLKHFEIPSTEFVTYFREDRDFQG